MAEARTAPATVQARRVLKSWFREEAELNPEIPAFTQD